METPFLSPATAAKVRHLALRGLATRFAVGDPVDLVLERVQADGTVLALPAQRVLVEPAAREAQERRGAAAMVSEADGAFVKREPFEAAVGDRFVLPNGSYGRIVAIPPPSMGTARAFYTLEGGGD